MESPTEQESPSNRRERTVELVPVLVKFNKEKLLGRDIQINRDVFKLGRGPDNNGIILDVSISRNHCVIQKSDSDFTIMDSSSSGTFLNGTKLIRNVTYPLKLDDELAFGDTKKFIYTMKMCPKEESPAVKRARMEVDLMQAVSAKQKIFEERQEAQMKEMEDKILLKQKQTEELTSRLDDLRKQKEAVQGESLEKNNQIKLLEEQIKASKDNQAQLQDNLKQLVDSMTEERRQFEVKLVEERRKWQEALDMTKQEKEVFERNMAEQMNAWKEQQLAAVATEKLALQKKLEETEKALKEQAAVAEQFRNQSVLLSEMTANKDCYLYKVSSDEEGTKLQVLETIDLTGENAPSTSNKGAEVGTKIMTAMDEQFTCSICQELFVMATTLNCTHTFCSHCIRSWRQKQHHCPICRSTITSMNRALVVDNFIDEAVGNLPQEEQDKRTQLLRERRDLEAPVATPAPQGGPARGGTPVTAPPQSNRPRAPRSNQHRAPPPSQPRPVAPNQPLQIRVPVRNQAIVNEIRMAVQNAVQQMRLPVQNPVALPGVIQHAVQQLRMPTPQQMQRVQPPRPLAPQKQQAPRRR
ncbi:E3 ubiquitin-protein ligase rnf8 [Diachasma alloeum]|uniref:E3 ubiquitin-protein ligase rnf8 n=1 Tax=Diachasma alloeum TaxID=454923 RepID=UPI00073820E6|nr:E3 ubiquitin-protein ligase rnf8 [Diachasma alloeum]